MKLVKVHKKDAEGKEVLKKADELLKLVDGNKVWMDVSELEQLEKKLLNIAKLAHNQASYYKNH